MKINVNDRVKVQLTDYGRTTLFNYYSEFNKNSYECFLQTDKAYKGGEFQLWELMQIFGKDMYCGNPKVPFVDNQIEIIE